MIAMGIGVIVIMLGALGLIYRKQIASSAKENNDRMWRTNKTKNDPIRATIPSMGFIVIGLVFIVMGIFDR